MKKVIILRGLPGSGKSTYAKQLLTEYPNAYKRINRDALRMMFDNGYSSKGNEKFVKKIRDVLIIQALEAGKHVIVDDTNLSQKNITRIKQLVGMFNKEHGDQVVVEVKEMETSLAECLARDAAREKRVGESVIRRMHRQFYNDGIRYRNQDAALPKAIICDLDGTLALLNGRDPYVAVKCTEDILNTPVAHVLATYKNIGYNIILLSGRLDTYKKETLLWLEKHNIQYDMLVMRKASDKRKDAIVKREFFDQHIVSKYYVEFVLDDRNQVVNLWRDELKLPCFQVYYGDF